jgi:D-glycero-D-manno-heptose 1,7-bisphosphate phosphatase
MQLTKILCLDLDGTVRRSKSGKTFIEGPDDIELIPGVLPLLKKYHCEGWILIAISNQGGVAHGFKTYVTMHKEFEVTYKLCWNNGPLFFDMLAATADPRGKVEPHTFRSLCRKPDYGMLAIAENKLLSDRIYPDWDNSLFIGDRPEDEECAKAAGIPFLHIDEFLKQPI